MVAATAGAAAAAAAAATPKVQVKSLIASHFPFSFFFLSLSHQSGRAAVIREETGNGGNIQKWISLCM